MHIAQFYDISLYKTTRTQQKQILHYATYSFHHRSDFTRDRINRTGNHHAHKKKREISRNAYWQK